MSRLGFETNLPSLVLVVDANTFRYASICFSFSSSELIETMALLSLELMLLLESVKAYGDDRVRVSFLSLSFSTVLKTAESSLPSEPELELESF